jgi:uncharacterized membrane protein
MRQPLFDEREENEVTQPGTESTTIRQRLLPQTSIRFFAFLIAISALAMYTLRAALVDGQQWAKIGSLLIATVIGCFVAYAWLFLFANLFSYATRVIWGWMPGRRSQELSESSGIAAEER